MNELQTITILVIGLILGFHVGRVYEWRLFVRRALRELLEDTYMREIIAAHLRTLAQAEDDDAT